MYKYHTLPNGMRIILNRTASRVVYAGVYVALGSRDESGDDEGMAHFIEHSLFKGTTHRRARHILNRIDGVGGELNAFTTKEETCVYATALTEHTERCIELFADVLFCSTFPEREIELEKEVVLEEIDSYNDAPAELIFDQFEEFAYEGHPLAHNILGTKRNVRRFSPERLRRRMAEMYTADRMVLSVVGDVDMARLVRMCERHFCAVAATAGEHESVLRKTKPTFRRFEREVHRRTHQAHLLIGCEAPGLYDADKTAFTLLNNLLGGPAMNSRLNIAVRERYGFCYSIESQYVPFSDTGLFYIYAGVDGGAQQRAREIVEQELARVAESALTARQLTAAQRQMVGQMAVAADNGSNEMQSIGKACLSFGRADTLQEMADDVMAVSAEDLRRVAEKAFAGGTSILIYR